VLKQEGAIYLGLEDSTLRFNDGLVAVFSYGEQTKEQSGSVPDGVLETVRRGKRWSAFRIYGTSSTNGAPRMPEKPKQTWKHSSCPGEPSKRRRSAAHARRANRAAD
jgi:hypothetical protein